MDGTTNETGRGGSSPNLSKRSSKILVVRVQMLDDTITMFQIQAKAMGSVLFEQVCQQVNLLESDYFGLEYTSSENVKFWLDLEKPMNRQLELSLTDPLLRFAVKFYAPDPAQLEEEFTRYLFCMQIKQDLAQGTLQCNDKTAALIASYLVQAECGDYVAEDYPDHTYLSSYRFVPHQDPELERRIMDNHKKHIGQSPAEADLNLLETARRCELYGVKMHPAKDPEGVPLNLAVAHMGVLVFQNFAKINTFSWAKVRKLSFKRKKFLIKLHPEAHGNYKDVVEFCFECRDECKNFWKKCVEHHGFFRCPTAKNEPRPKPGVLSRGSSFRYTGRTQKEIIEFVRENYVKRQSFQRSQSFRHTSPLHTSGVGTSLSVHPLLPVGDNVIVANDSMSCGSVAAISDSRARSISTPERTETVDVHRSREPRSMSGHRDVDVEREMEVESPITSNNSASSSSPHHPPYHYHQQPSQTPSGVFHSLPRTAGSSSSALPSPSADEDLVAGQLREEEEEEEEPQVKETTEPVHQSKSPNGVAGKLPSPPLSPLLGHSIENNNNINNNIGNTSAKSSNGPVEGEMRRKRHPTEKAYYIAKELLMTERTYKKDLEVIDLWFRDELNKEEYMPEEVLTLLFNHVDPLYEHHTLLLKELEHRMAAWEGRTTTFTKGDVHRIGDLLLKITSKLELYNRYIEKHRLILEKLEQSFKRNKTFEQIYRDFETRKVCYLPLNTFLLRPLQRILHYQLIVERLLKHYEPNHIDYNDCTQSRMQMEHIITNITHNIHATENFVKLVELQRDLVGIDNVVNPNRQFLREGCLQKLSRKGFQQRMFFLFSDVLLYTNRTSGPQLQFKVHGQLPLRGVMVEESEPKMGNQFCFTIYGGNRALLVAANSQEEKDKWLEDLVQAVQAARELSDDASRINYFSLKSCSSSEEVLDKTGAAEDSSVGTNGKERTQQQRSNTTVHVCWHRNTSISTRDHLLALENQLSGYLLRKFKNSNGWQKLWVVFTNFCLFFYKTFQDDFPLASLPLLGYSVTSPNERDHIQKEFVFKLQFKNHVYFFRAESEYTFNRWMEVISSATQHSGRLRLFSRKESETVSPRF
ncbi:FERM, ARHGEF and pleckstrin domain-containing protein 1-like [Daphnia pulex]|uniref:FERM, ARHGEF and pleckstrin domain-containing protein 1-like n=1 Tax=Daphnia pulex TaxID=6669 RepID=UPI001EDE3867|nr:FERM, ARHGEF and pleckstrin domain-containing protein 1-like [Daphnia pulex]